MNCYSAETEKAREFVRDSIHGARPWVADLRDGHGLGALESHNKMQLLIDVLKTRYTYTFKEVTLPDGLSHKGRFHLFETSEDKGLNLLVQQMTWTFASPSSHNENNDKLHQILLESSLIDSSYKSNQQKALFLILVSYHV